MTEMTDSEKISALYKRINSEHDISHDDVMSIAHAVDDRPWDAVRFAGMLREDRFKDVIDPCSIINARSGNCPEDCAFCAQSVHHDTGVSTYPMLPERTIVEAARRAFGHGVRRFCIVTSGRGINSDGELTAIARCVEKIRDIGILPCATLGTLDSEQLGTLKDAGLHRYHHNIETSESFFPRICSTHSYQERVETLLAAKSTGLSVCSGGIIGMGEDMAHRAEMALASGRSTLTPCP